MQIEEVGGECSIKCSDMHQWLDLFLMQKNKTNKKQKKNSGLGREEQKPITKTKKKNKKHSKINNRILFLENENGNLTKILRRMFPNFKLERREWDGNLWKNHAMRRTEIGHLLMKSFVVCPLGQ